MEILKKKDIQDLSVGDINKKVKSAKKFLFDLRIKNKLQSLKEKHLIGQTKKYVAVLKTIANEKIFVNRFDSIMKQLESSMK